MTDRLAWLVSRPIAHRGLHDGTPDAPENSLPAVLQAAEAGFPVEIDVQLLADGQVAVFHDLTLERLTGRAMPLLRCTAGDLRDLPLLGGRHTIPLLGEVLQAVAGRVGLLIEIKNPHRHDRRPEQAVAALLDDYAGPVAVQSFNPFSLRWFRKRRPEIPRGQLSGGFRHDSPAAVPLGGPLKLAARHLLVCRVSRPTFIAYDVRCLPAWAPLRMRRAGVPLLGWTVRSPAEMRRALEFCDNVIFEGFRPDGADG